MKNYHVGTQRRKTLCDGILAEWCGFEAAGASTMAGTSLSYIFQVCTDMLMLQWGMNVNSGEWRWAGTEWSKSGICM